MKKKLLSILLASSMAVSLAACGKKDEDKPQDQPAGPEQQQPNNDPGQFQSIFNAQVTDNGVQGQMNWTPGQEIEVSAPEDNSDNRGRFSNVPDDFDKN